MKTRHKTLHYKNRAIFNTIGYVMVIAVNIIAGLGLINGNTTAQVSGKYDNLFVPAGFTFGIWGLIYLALLGFIIYQLWLAFTPGHTETLTLFMERLRGWWLISCMANSCWLFAWHYELLPLSLLLLLILLTTLIAIHLNFNISQPGKNRREKLLIDLPFSLYLGWICFATIANIGALLVYNDVDGDNVPITIVLIGISTVVITTLVVRRNNVITGAVAIWALYGIIAKRHSEGGNTATPVIVTCLIAMAIVLLTAIRQLVRRNSKSYK